MELLIIKSGDQYIRIKDTDYLTVNLDKASVFPMGKLDELKRHKEKMQSLDFKSVVIKKLVLTEKDL